MGNSESKKKVCREIRLKTEQHIGVTKKNERGKRTKVVAERVRKS